MDEQPDENAGQGLGFFKSANGLIAGITGLVVAFGGLVTAYHEFIQKPRREAAANAENAVSQEANNVAAADSQAADTQAPEDQDPWSYDTDADGTLLFKGGLWIETDAVGTVTRYTPESVEDGFTYASDKGAGPNGQDVFLRWPTKGGQAEKKRRPAKDLERRVCRHA